MLIISVFFSIVLGLYIGLMILYRVGWQRQKTFFLCDDFLPRTTISVIIPARNEAKNITDCVRSILENFYPASLVEVIVVNDHSTDGTEQKVRKMDDTRVKCIDLADFISSGEVIQSYKKKALECGIRMSRGSLIVTTDADCIAPRQWLIHMAAIHEGQQAALVIAPVSYRKSDGFLGIFQSVDFMMMQGITGAAQYFRLGSMSNGANLAFTRESFEAVGGYRGTEHLASGDDFLLTRKIYLRFPDSIAYLKSSEAIVETDPPETVSGFFRQRIRWASKAGKYDDIRLTRTLAVVYLFNVILFVLTCLSFTDIFWARLAVLFWGAKIVVEGYLFWPVARFFGKSGQLWGFLLLQPFHVLYVIISGFLGFWGSYEWKGRRTK